VRELAELRHGGVCVGRDLVQLAGELLALCPLSRGVELDLDCKQPLLRAVVQVALEPKALALLGGDDAAPRRNDRASGARTEASPTS